VDPAVLLCTSALLVTWVGCDTDVRGGPLCPPKRVFPSICRSALQLDGRDLKRAGFKWAGNGWVHGTCTVTTGKFRLFCWWRASEPFGSGCYSASCCRPYPSREPPFFARPNRRQ
jgi:hypothetical protein